MAVVYSMHVFENAMQPTVAETAWAAGIVDGEGCIHISRGCTKTRRRLRLGKWVSGTRYDYRLIVKVKMTHAPTIRRLGALFPASAIYGQKLGKPHYSPPLSVQWNNRKARQFLLAIRPYLFTKAREADLALLYPLVSRSEAPAYKPLKETLYAKLRNLKTSSTSRRHCDSPIPGTEGITTP